MDNTDIFSFPFPFPFPNRNVNRIFDGTIESVSRERGTTFVTVGYSEASRPTSPNPRGRGEDSRAAAPLGSPSICIGCPGGSGSVRLVIRPDTVIYDERGRSIRANELERGMTIDAIFSSAMTRSIPPQAQAFFIRVTGRAASTAVTTGRIVEVNTRSNFILVLRNQNPSSAIRFNLSPNTVIYDLLGRRIRISSLRPGLRVRVEHSTFMTASLPPQATAFTVRVIR